MPLQNQIPCLKLHPFNHLFICLVISNYPNFSQFIGVHHRTSNQIKQYMHIIYCVDVTHKIAWIKISLSLSVYTFHPRFPYCPRTPPPQRWCPRGLLCPPVASAAIRSTSLPGATPRQPNDPTGVRSWGSNLRLLWHCRCFKYFLFLTDISYMNITKWYKMCILYYRIYIHIQT